jgi:predicted ArsR family transcriptional regulator
MPIGGGGLSAGGDDGRFYTIMSEYERRASQASSQLDHVGDSRRTILSAIKENEKATIAQLASLLGSTREAVRQHLVQLTRLGWVQSTVEAPRKKGHGGRPAASYSLTPEGEQVFPKRYDRLSVALLGVIEEQLGREALLKVLGGLADRYVREWEPRLSGLPLAARVEALKDIYSAGDPYTAVEEVSGGYRLIERNCPFLKVAMERPAICSVTVNTMSRLLGAQVRREERFQSGRSRCVFRISADQPSNNSHFELEPD